MPTVFIDGPFRYYFFSREETRRHIHVSSSEGEMKVWLEPKIEVAKVVNLSQQEVTKILNTVEARKEQIDEFWNKHFKTN